MHGARKRESGYERKWVRVKRERERETETEKEKCLASLYYCF